MQNSQGISWSCILCLCSYVGFRFSDMRALMPATSRQCAYLLVPFRGDLHSAGDHGGRTQGGHKGGDGEGGDGGRVRRQQPLQRAQQPKPLRLGQQAQLLNLPATATQLSWSTCAAATLSPAAARQAGTCPTFIALVSRPSCSACQRRRSSGLLAHKQAQCCPSLSMPRCSRTGTTSGSRYESAATCCKCRPCLKALPEGHLMS